MKVGHPKGLRAWVPRARPRLATLICQGAAFSVVTLGHRRRGHAGHLELTREPREPVGEAEVHVLPDGHANTALVGLEAGRLRHDQKERRRVLSRGDAADLL